MKHACVLLALVALTFGVVHAALGYEATYQIGYGALTLMAALISATFLMLFLTRSTPLALGMAFSWGGASSVLGWWWFYNLLNKPSLMYENEVLFGFLSLYFVGALLHFMVMQKSFGFPKGAFLLPVAISIGAATLIHVFV